LITHEALSIVYLKQKVWISYKLGFLSKSKSLDLLRHSLAGFLLEQKTPLPVISEVLGHQNTESTRVYLSIDRAALKQCALDVPPINKSFYEAEVPVC